MSKFSFGLVFGIALFAVGLNNILLECFGAEPSIAVGLIIMILGVLFVIGCSEVYE